MYNEMVNGSLPLSVLEFPAFFVLQDQFFVWENGENYIKRYNNMVELMNITVEAMRNYHYLWMTYIKDRKNFTLVCVNDKSNNCSINLFSFTLLSKSLLPPNNYKLFENYASAIRKNPEKGIGMLIEGEVTAPPCSVPENVKKFKIGPICSMFKNINGNTDAFLKLMKFTKQSPVFMEEENEYKSIFSSAVSKYGYILKKNKEVCF